ncbi:ATP-dependent helicase [Desulforamulus profundi]|uniref:ATP-dependent helicase n=1 Tax=Desulforamulus profundi TaxID=1383067 RepID=A0A2C6MCA5_9FIRM|nr:SNF2-related protein [Desulforamulus profundi]PHJ36836.1 ATP-dependent helicase [Desulforamulus profundi]
MNTNYHAKYFAHEILRRHAANHIGKLSMSLFDACVDLNPHQVEAALFAFRSPLSKGVLLADEVGLGKTIEAGLVLCQYWAERRRKLLVICPASLRKQWSMELQEKFNLPSLILESKNYREALKQGIDNPFQQAPIIITSYNFANRHKNEIRLVSWDLVVIDEAHNLRNVYKTGNKIGQGIRWAVEDSKKLLLTATPLQNSLLELYGLSTLIDDHLFGSLAAFRTQYVHEGDLAGLKIRLQKFCHRTLRRQVLEYIKYTERKAITRPFRPTDREQELYQAISSFLQREDTYAIPSRQRELTTLILRKLLASSSLAVAGTLETIKQRLEKILAEVTENDQGNTDNPLATLLDVDQLLEQDELTGDILEEDDDREEDQSGECRPEASPTKIDIQKLKREIAELTRYITWARSIEIDTKSKTLLQSLEIGFHELEKMGAQRKALIFTESRRTQDYLYQFLSANGYQDKIVLFNGTNTDPASKAIYTEWLQQNQCTDRISGSRTADQRAALVEYFRDKAEIMIATESAAEGVNLQFCSLVVNYDLPWNPQRIEQRIGRCHRYGQRHDVVVINFLNERNQADQRVYELLQEKFNLFNGVLGASDEVLGSIESGVDFERRILSIYQQCRTPQEIEAAFKALQDEMEQTIKSRLEDTRKVLLENFDEDVHQRLKLQHDEARRQLDRFSQIFWNLTKNILARQATFNDQTLAFELKNSPGSAIPKGKYYLYQRRGLQENQPALSDQATRAQRGFLYRLSHPLGEYVLQEAKNRPTPTAELTFNISDHPVKISVVENLKGQRGYLTLTKLSIETFEREEYLLFNAITDEGKVLDQEICEKLFQCRAEVVPLGEIPAPYQAMLKREAAHYAAATINRVLEESNRAFQEERDRLEKWADDLVLAAEKELKETKAKIKALNRQSRLATSTEEQHQIQVKLQELTKLQRRQRQRIFEVEDEILEKRDELIQSLEKRLQQRTEQETLFTIRWVVR